MNSATIRQALTAFFLLAMLSSAPAKLVPPSDALVFRRDLLPVDVATMSTMSSQLTDLAAGIEVREPASLRTGVQLLALARALDPLNPDVAVLLEAWKKNIPIVKRPSADQRARLLPQLWRTQTWLSSKEAGECGQRFAACLGDVLAKLDPAHPTATQHTEEQGAWQGWVASATDFADEPTRESSKVNELAEMIKNTASNSNGAGNGAVDRVPAEGEPIAIANGNNEAPAPTERITPAATPSILLPVSRIATPLWVTDANLPQTQLVVTTIELNAQKANSANEQNAHYNFDLVSNQQQHTLCHELEQLVLPACKDAIGPNPPATTFNFILTDSQPYDFQKNSTAVSAACAVLQAASITGKKPTGVVIGQLNNQGLLLLPPHAWSMLLLLRDYPASRVVVPIDAAKLLPGFLTMEQSDFFLRHDVFCAKNTTQLIALSTTAPEARIARALNEFAEIRAKAPAALGAFLTNPFVIKRLEGIVESAPEFASAQLLLIQARGQRPTEFNSTVALNAIQHALQPLLWLASNDFSHTEPNQVDVSQVQLSHEQCRNMLDPMGKWIGSNDRKTYERVLELVNSARTYARACKSLQSGNNKNEATSRKNANDLIRTLRNELPAIMRQRSRLADEN